MSSKIIPRGDKTLLFNDRTYTRTASTGKEISYPPNTLLFDDTGLVYIIIRQPSTGKTYNCLAEVDTNWGVIRKLGRTLSDLYLVASTAHAGYTSYNKEQSVSKAMGEAVGHMIVGGGIKLGSRYIGDMFPRNSHTELKYINVATNKIYRNGVFTLNLDSYEQRRFLNIR